VSERRAAPGEELPVQRAEDLAVWRVEDDVVGRRRRVVIDNDYEMERENGIWSYGRAGA